MNQVIVRVCAGFSLAVSMLVLCGWIFDIPAFRSILPDYISMKANTAFALMALAFALLAFEKETLSKTRVGITIGFASFAALIAILTSLQYIFHVNFGIDELFFLDPIKPTAKFPAGRLAPITALTTIVLSVAFALMLPKKPFTRSAQALAFIALLLAFQSFVGYVCGVTYSFGNSYYSQMAIHTSISFCLLAVGFLFARPQAGTMPLVTSQTIVGRNVRYLLAGAMLIPPLVNAFEVKAVAWGWIPADTGVLLRVMGNVVFFFGIVWRTSSILAKTESQRAELEAKRTELVASKQAALQASTLKSHFVANTSHELRTPINGIVGMTDLVLDTKLTDEQREMMNTIRSSADSLLAIVNDILDLSKIEAGRIELENAVFEPSRILEDLQRTFILQTKKRGLDLIVDRPQEVLGKFRGDANRIRQVLVNLVANSVKFTPNGRITIKAMRTAETEKGVTLRFEVLDTGIGFDTGAKEKMFQPFEQGDTTTTRRYGGTGLGLSISKSIVEMMGGTITAESVPGLGSRVWFTVNLEKHTAPEVVSPTSSAPKTAQKSCRILIVEDNLINQKVTHAMVTKFGHVADIAANGKEALDSLKSESYDLILMDCLMPEMDGYETTRQIRGGKHALKVPSTIPIIAVTASAVSGDRERCLEAGMNDYLSKPIKSALLEHALEQWLNASAAVAKPA